MNRPPHWNAIYDALGDTRPMSTTYLDEPEETWFAVMGQGIFVWSRGSLHADRIESPVIRADSRTVFYASTKSLYVELAVYGSRGIVTCAVDNGFHRTFDFAVEELEALCAHYESVGFTQVGPWHLNEEQCVVREYRSPDDKRVVRVDGNTVWVGDDRRECADRALAEAWAETAVAELSTSGFRFVLMETLSSSGANPPPFTAPVVPDLRSWPEPANARDAVDQAVARLTELHDVFPRANAVLELLSATDEAARVLEFVEDVEDLKGLGDWSEPVQVDASESSFTYFTKRYGTLTWSLLDCWNGPDDHVPVFHSENAHRANCAIDLGKGWRVEADMADDYDLPDMVHLHVIQSGDQGLALDTRFTSPEGEHPVVDFDLHEPELSSEAPESVQPFGFWLLEHVKELTEDALPWLITTQG